MGWMPVLLSSDTLSTIRSTQPPKPVNEKERKKLKEAIFIWKSGQGEHWYD